MHDGDLSARIFSLLRVMDQGFHQTRHNKQSHQRLDIAMLSFFQSFRKVYVGEHVMKTSSEVSSYATDNPLTTIMNKPYWLYWLTFHDVKEMKERGWMQSAMFQLCQ